MSFAFRASLLFLALSLILVHSAPAQSQSSSSASKAPPLIFGSPQSSDEATLRALTEKYGLAIAAGDLEAMRQFWDPQSPNLAPQLKVYQDIFSRTRFEFVSLKVTRLEVAGAKAVSHLTTDERQLEKKTGFVTGLRDVYYGNSRALEWNKTDAGWKIEREFTVQVQLAAKLEAAASDSERQELLEKEREFVTGSLVGVLFTRGDRYRAREDYDKALLCYRLAQAVSEKIGDQTGVAAGWDYMGLVRIAQSDYEQALPRLRKSLALFEAAGDKPGEALTLEHLSSVYLHLGDYLQSFECAQKSFRLFEEANNPKGMAQALTELASVYSVQNNPQQALAHEERAMKIFEESEDIIQIAMLRNAMAREHLAEGHYERAIELYQQILKQTEGFRDRIGAAVIRDEIGRIYAAQGRYAEALNYYRQALSVLETSNSRDRVTQTLINLSNAYLADRQYAEAGPFAERAASLARQTVSPRNLYSALTSLGYCQLGLNRPAEARQAFDEAVSIIEKLRAQAAGGVEERQRYFERGLDAYHGMLSLLAQENRPGEALIFAERSKARALLDVLENGRVSIQKAMTAEEREQERRLYDLLLKPADAQLQGKTNLVITPDDSLWDLPFQALLADDKRYVLEKSAVSYAPSLTVLREMAKARGRGAETASMSLLAFGNPALGEETVARAGLAVRDEKLGPLPEAEAEVKGLGRLYGAARSKIYVGAEAREDRVKSEAGAFHVLHFATHGVLNNAAPMYSHLVLAQGDKNDDGLLEAWELMQMDLRADLVVLSACETARGRFGAGEGVIGLSWAMFVAGAPATVVSQWSVESASTQELMLDFHKRLMAPSRKPLTKAEALRQAALKLMKSPGDSHPFYWAGFVLVGDGR